MEEVGIYFSFFAFDIHDKQKEKCVMMTRQIQQYMYNIYVPIGRVSWDEFGKEINGDSYF